ncbi:MAG: hypothetical protein KME12_20835 [Trichocoleus desertorum ATA4-8-CV12]|jgi:hypothetical protein|nr:hypothetical protein [Trichocoleus desertorum ATA4-8-CV12]
MKRRFTGRSIAQRAQNLALMKRLTSKAQAIAQRIQKSPLRQRLAQKISAIAIAMEQWLTQEITLGQVRRFILALIQAVLSRLQFGRIFRLLGLPFWTFIGIGIAGWWFDNAAILIQQVARYWFRIGEKPPTVEDYLPALIMFLIPFAVVLVISAWHGLRRPLTKAGIIQDGLRKPEGKKGLIILVSNPASALFTIEYHLQHNRLEKVWLIPSNDLEAERFGPNSRENAKTIQQKCEQLAQQYNRDFEVEIHATGVSPAEAQDTFDCVNQIFRRSRYGATDMIADFTGGTKPMSVGMIMACLPRHRELEYVSFNPATKQTFGPFLIDYQHSAFDLVG